MKKDFFFLFASEQLSTYNHLFKSKYCINTSKKFIAKNKVESLLQKPLFTIFVDFTALCFFETTMRYVENCNITLRNKLCQLEFFQSNIIHIKPTIVNKFKHTKHSKSNKILGGAELLILLGLK